jgi:tetratricopeptide (TPR) repeat protein
MLQRIILRGQSPGLGLRALLGASLTLVTFVVPVELVAADRSANAATDANAAGSSPAGTSSAEVAPLAEEASGPRVKQLIRQLGSARYAERRAASRELRQIGAEAFDLLNAAVDDNDPEVAASAQYLLRQITVRWIQPGDTAAVRVLLRDFGSQSEEMRSARIAGLTALPNGEGLPALCRIARFDRSPLISREAALAVIRPDDRPTSRTAIDPDILSQELGTSTRVGSIWLRQYFLQLRDPAASIASWQRLIDEEAARLEDNPNDTSTTVILDLLWNLADLHRELGQKNELIAAIDRMIQLESDSPDETAIELLTWLPENKLWDVLDDFLAKHEPRFQQSKRPMYYAALARASQGKQELGEELAKKAAELDPQTGMESFVAAKDLEEHAQFEWAVREYKRSIDKEQIGSGAGILARVYLANLYHDYEQHDEAAEILQPLVKAVQGDGNVGQLYTNLRRFYSRQGDSILPEAEALGCRMHYFRACQYREEEDWSRVREELQRAIRFDPTDADVLIAMYRVPDADDKWRQTTLAQIRELARQFQQQIEEDPSDRDPYNQWAWLISNTEGDYQQAIRYSHRSLELIPAGADESAGASYLDTLGRCYYAAGDLENAVKYQRQAVAKVDYMQVMQRQLALFEKALAEKQGAGEQGAGSGDQRNPN